MVVGAAAGGLAFLVLIIIVGILVVKVCRRSSPPVPANTMGETKIVVYTGAERPKVIADGIPIQNQENPMFAREPSAYENPVTTRESGIYDSIVEEVSIVMLLYLLL